MTIIYTHDVWYIWLNAQNRLNMKYYTNSVTSDQHWPIT